MEIKNAIIESTKIELHGGMLTIWLFTNDEMGTQGFGGYRLYQDGQDDNAGKFMTKIMNLLEVENWNHVTGKAIRIRRDGGWNSPIVAIGHFINDVWFEPSKDLK